jgi:hypothetical protein
MLRKLPLFLLVAIGLMLAACGGGGGGTTTNNASSVSLSETYDGDDVSFKYPSGWVVQAPAAPGGPVMLANNQAALDAMSASGTTTAASGQQAVIVMPFVGDAGAAITATASSPMDLLKQMIPSMSSGTNNITFGDPTEATIGGNTAARATGTGDSGDGKIIVIKVGDAGYVLVMGVTAKGELGNIEGSVDGLAESITVKT